jgi:flavin-dependent dehydrogenase
MYDSIVIGARCAGSPTAMLLARKGYKVLLVDRAAFPSPCLTGTSSIEAAPDSSTSGDCWTSSLRRAVRR